MDMFEWFHYERNYSCVNIVVLKSLKEFVMMNNYNVN